MEGRLLPAKVQRAYALTTSVMTPAFTDQSLVLHHWRRIINHQSALLPAGRVSVLAGAWIFGGRLGGRPGRNVKVEREGALGEKQRAWK